MDSSEELIMQIPFLDIVAVGFCKWLQAQLELKGMLSVSYYLVIFENYAYCQ